MPSIQGGRVKNLRSKKSLTQGQLAGYSGVSQTYISEIELGRKLNVGSESLVRLARVLETSTDYLTGRTEDPRSPARPPLGELAPDEEELLLAYRALPSDDIRQMARMIMDTLRRQSS